LGKEANTLGKYEKTFAVMPIEKSKINEKWKGRDLK